MFYLKLKFKGGYIMRRLLSILVFAVFGVVALSSIGLAEEIVLKGGNILAPSAAQARELDKWAELAKERSNG